MRTQGERDAGQEAGRRRRRRGRIEKRGGGRESERARQLENVDEEEAEERRIGEEKEEMERWREEQKRGRWEDRRCRWGQRGDRESLFEATGRGGRGGCDDDDGGGVDGGGGRVPWVIPCPSPRSIAPTDEITTSKIAGDRRRVHRAKYDLECGNRMEREKRENLFG